MPPAVSINTLCLGPGRLDAHAAQVARLGAAAISPVLQQVVEYGAANTRKLLADTGLAVATLTHRAFAFATPDDAAAARQRLDETIELAASIGAQTITLTSGGRGTLRWPEAAARFAAEIAPCVIRAAAAGVVLSLEPTSHLYADVSIAHRLADTVALANRAGIGVGIDLFACWSDADIEPAIAAAGPNIALVQVSDYVYGDRGLPCRAVPGDGDMPLDWLISLILNTGFTGYFDLEVIGPRLEAEGAEAGLHRALAWLAHALESSRGR